MMKMMLAVFWLLNVLLMVENTSEKLFHIIPLEDSFSTWFCFAGVSVFLILLSPWRWSESMRWNSVRVFSLSSSPAVACFFICVRLWHFQAVFLSLSVLQWFVVCVCLSEALFLNLVMQISKSSYKAVYYELFTPEARLWCLKMLSSFGNERLLFILPPWTHHHTYWFDSSLCFMLCFETIKHVLSECPAKLYQVMILFRSLSLSLSLVGW